MHLKYLNWNVGIEKNMIVVSVDEIEDERIYDINILETKVTSEHPNYLDIYTVEGDGYEKIQFKLEDNNFLVGDIYHLDNEGEWEFVESYACYVFGEDGDAVEEDMDNCIMCGDPFLMGETGNELGFCTTCTSKEDFPYDLDAYYKDYEANKVAFKGFDTMDRGLLENYKI